MTKKFINYPLSIIHFPRMGAGFTLIELLVVIAIIGLLATLLMSNLMGVRERARDAQRKSDLNQIQKALELYKGNQSPVTYPASLSSLTADYIKEEPHDSKCPGGICAAGWVDYDYDLDPEGTGDTLTYELIACLENASDPQRDSTKQSYCNSQPASYTVTEP